MKNRFIACTLILALALSFGACGKKDDSAKKSDKKEKAQKVQPIEYDVDEYVTLGQYKDLELTLEGEYEYSDEGYDAYVQQSLDGAAVYVEDSEQKEIKEDSIVNVDYVGSQDGVAFEGGSAEDQLIDVANNSSANGGGYIEGFSAGLVGHTVGEEVAYDVTFPKEYGNADLAGKTVVFTFQVNYIAKPITSKDDLTDDIVSKNLGYDTVDAYLKALKDEYTESLESNLKNDKETALLNAIENNCKVSEVPEALLQARVDMYLNVMDLRYQAYGTTAKEYYESMGQDYDAYVEQMKDGITESTKTEMILEAIAKAEKIEADDKGFKDFMKDVLESTGASSQDELFEMYSADGYEGERYFRQAFLTQKAMDFCAESAKVNTKAAAAE